MNKEEATSPAGSSPDAVAWRLSAVEKEVNQVRSELKSSVAEVLGRLDGISNGFATHKDIEVAKEQAKLEHEAIYEKIRDVEKDVVALKKRNWVQNTLSAVMGSILTFLAIRVVSDFLQ